MSSDFLDWLDEDSGDRRVQRRLESELQDAYSYQARESSALRSESAATAFAARVAELRAAAQQATADHETITAALSGG